MKQSREASAEAGKRRGTGWAAARRLALNYLLAGMFLFGIVFLFARALAPEQEKVAGLSEAEMSDLATLRDSGIGQAGAKTRWREVDYGEGAEAAWWPRVDPASEYRTYFDRLWRQGNCQRCWTEPDRSRWSSKGTRMIRHTGEPGTGQLCH